MWGVKCFKIIYICYLKTRGNLLKEHRSKLNILGAVKTLKICPLVSFCVILCFLSFSASSTYGSGFFQALILKQLTALPTSKKAKFFHSTLMSIIGLVENFFWRRKHIPCLHQKELIQILKHFCASPGLSSAATHRVFLSPFLSLVQCPGFLLSGSWGFSQLLSILSVLFLYRLSCQPPLPNAE